MAESILVVEDSDAIRLPLVYLLQQEGYDVSQAADGPEALLRFGSSEPDLVLLDLMLPGLSGIEVCKAIRQKSEIPIIMLTAKDTESDIIAGLEAGADDYMTKPYSSGELKARIRAVLRRKHGENREQDVITAGNIVIDIDRHVVTVDGEPVTMPLKEFELLSYLSENAGRVLTRGQLIDRVWGESYFGDTKTLDVHIKRVRAKIEPDPNNPSRLVTIRGLGYKLND
ncbi:MAG TPA: response regulator transcription factor [Pseudoclavibacter sp.]|nr:response regulator transcription factor [Pseudoclavibacter sp.]